MTVRNCSDTGRVEYGLRKGTATLHGTRGRVNGTKVEEANTYLV